MMSLIRQNATPLALTAAIVLSVSFLATMARAGEAPPSQVTESVEAIHDNQQRIAELRKYVDEFNFLKEDNAKLVGRMEAFGWTMDWSKNDAVKMDPK